LVFIRRKLVSVLSEGTASLKANLELQLIQSKMDIEQPVLVVSAVSE
jgi:hypothetical protein